MHASVSKLPFKSSLTIAALLGCSAMILPSDANAAVAAKTSWAVSRVASMSQGSYCTMAQKYADATVLTFARNTRGEYSLALDFTEPHFKMGEKQTITLRPKGGVAQTYGVTPQSDKTVVVGIGKDDAVIKQITSTENLDIELGGKRIAYELSQFSSGQKELGNCIEALQGSKDKSADLVASNKTGIASPEVQVNRQVTILREEDAAAVPVEAVAKEPSVEGLLAAKPTPSVGVAAISSEEMDIIPVAPKIAETTKKSKATSDMADAKLAKEIDGLREENARLTRSISEQRQSFENKQASGNGAALDELRQKLEAEKSEKESLKAQLASASSVSTKGNLERPSADKLSALATEIERQKQTAEALKAENATLKNQLQMASKVVPAQSDDANGAATGDEKLRAEMRDLKGQFETVQAEKVALQEQLNKVQKETEAGQMKLAGGSWDLEQATRRYQESQREIQRLGSMLQTKDTQCTKEKKEIEYMLFDPAIAKSSQVAMLNSLEDQVAEKDQKLKALEVELETANAQIKESPEKDKQIAGLEQQLTITRAEMTKKIEEASLAQNNVIASLKSELAKKDKEVFETQSKLANAQNKALQAEGVKDTVVSQEKTLAALKSDLEQKNKQLAELQTKAQLADQAQLAVASKDQTLTLLKADLEQKNKQLAELQTKVQLADQAQLAVASKDQTLASLKAELDIKNRQLGEVQSKVQQSGQVQSASIAAQEVAISTLKAQLAQTQAQLVAEQVRTQQFDAKASAEQATSLATLQMQIQQGSQKIAELQGQISGMKMASVQAAAMAPAAAATAQPLAVAPPAAQPVSFAAPSQPAVNFMSVEDFSTLLSNVGVPVKGALQQVKGGDPSTYRAYSWKTDSLYGSVEMRQLSTSSSFDKVIEQYLSRAKSRCAGEFAAVPSQIKAPETEQSKSYEIACVNQNASSSASVLFTYGKGIAMTVAHEGRAEAMDMAMDARDRISAQIR